MPGGARAAAAGACTVSEPELAVKLSGTKCWSMSLWCVSAPSETRFTERIEAASGVETVKFEPYVAPAGALAIVGREPLNRYGGE